MFPSTNSNLVQLCGSPAVNTIPTHMFGPRHSSPDPQFSFNSPRPPNVDPILCNQGQIQAPSVLGLGPHLRLFAPPVRPMATTQGVTIPWGSGAFQGFTRPILPTALVQQPQLGGGLLPTPPVQPPVSQPMVQVNQEMVQSDHRTVETLQNNPHQTLQNNPHKTVQNNPHQTVQNNPHQTVQNNPHQTVQNNPHQTVQNNPHQTGQNIPHEQDRHLKETSRHDHHREHDHNDRRHSRHEGGRNRQSQDKDSQHSTYRSSHSHHEDGDRSLDKHGRDSQHGHREENHVEPGEIIEDRYEIDNANERGGHDRHELNNGERNDRHRHRDHDSHRHHDHERQHRNRLDGNDKDRHRHHDHKRHHRDRLDGNDKDRHRHHDHERHHRDRLDSNDKDKHRYDSEKTHREHERQGGVDRHDTASDARNNRHGGHGNDRHEFNSVDRQEHADRNDRHDLDSKERPRHDGNDKRDKCDRRGVDSTDKISRHDRHEVDSSDGKDRHGGHRKHERTREKHKDNGGRHRVNDIDRVRNSESRSRTGALLLDDRNEAYSDDLRSGHFSNSRVQNSGHGNRSGDGQRDRDYSGDSGWLTNDRGDYRRNSEDRISRYGDISDIYDLDRGHRDDRYRCDSREKQGQGYSESHRYGLDYTDDFEYDRKGSRKRDRSPDYDEYGNKANRGSNYDDRRRSGSRHRGRDNDQDFDQHSDRGGRSLGNRSFERRRSSERNRAVLKDDRIDERQGKGAVLIEDNRVDDRRQKGAVLIEDDRIKERRGKGAVLIEDVRIEDRRGKGAVLIEDRHETYSKKTSCQWDTVLKEDRNDRNIEYNRDRYNSTDRRARGGYEESRKCGRAGKDIDRTRHSGAVLLDDRDNQRPTLHGKVSITGSTGALLIEERDRVEGGFKGGKVSTKGSTGALLIEERDRVESGIKGGKVGTKVSTTGSRGALLIEERDRVEGGFKGGKVSTTGSTGALLIEERDIVEGGFKGGKISTTGSTGALLIEERDIVEGGFKGGKVSTTGSTGAVLIEERERVESGKVSTKVSTTGSTGALLIEDRDKPIVVEKPSSHRGYESDSHSSVLALDRSRPVTGRREGRESDARSGRGQGDYRDSVPRGDRGHDDYRESVSRSVRGQGDYQDSVARSNRSQDDDRDRADRGNRRHDDDRTDADMINRDDRNKVAKGDQGHSDYRDDGYRDQRKVRNSVCRDNKSHADDRSHRKDSTKDNRNHRGDGVAKDNRSHREDGVAKENRSHREDGVAKDNGSHRGDGVAKDNRNLGGERDGVDNGYRSHSVDNRSKRDDSHNVARDNRDHTNANRSHSEEKYNVARGNKGHTYDSRSHREDRNSVPSGDRGQDNYTRLDGKSHRSDRNHIARGNRSQEGHRRDDGRSHRRDRDNLTRGYREGDLDWVQYGSDLDYSSRGNSIDRGRERSFSPLMPFNDLGLGKRSRSSSLDSRSSEVGRFKRQRIEDLPEEQCVRSGIPIIPTDKTSEFDAESVSAWVRCSPADLYFKKDMKTGNLETSKRMQELEKKFDHDLVQRAGRIKASQVPYKKAVLKPKLNFKHTCEKHHCHGTNKCKDSKPLLSDSGSSSSSSDSDDSEEEEQWMELVRHKQANPYRMHKELWYNEAGELNYGPLCRCRPKSRSFGIRHDIYPGEKPLPKCTAHSNNLDKLYHYKITVSPVTNFLTKHPTVINFDGHEYMFEGFSIFSHKPIPKLPPCQVIRFNIVYTIHIIEEQAPENFSVESLDLFAKFMFDEIIELVDIDWKGPGGDEHCRRFHVMPRFARPFPENGKEVLSMNDVFLYLLKASKPIIEPSELSSRVKLDNDSWQHFVDGFRHMVVTCPGKRPSSIRIDQLDKHGCETADNQMYPVIVHHGNRPPQLSYVGDNTYKKKWKEYLKFRHLLWTRTKVSAKDKDKLEEYETDLQRIRTKCTMKKEVSVEISSEGFVLTGIRSDMCQHAMMLPILFNHVRFHECLSELEKRIGYTFKDKSLIQLALTHASYKVNFGTNPDHGRNSMYNCGSRHVEQGDVRIHHQHTRKRGLIILLRIMSKMAKKREERSEIPHNERLEFLGDAVVEFITSIHLFYMFPQADEGELTTYRGALVENAHFSVLAEKLGLHEYLLYAHGPDLCHDADLKHAMANCFEALMGALYLDGGIDVADRVFSKALFDEPDLLDIWKRVPKHPLQAEEVDGDRHWIDTSPALQKIVNFEKDIGYEFHNIRLLAKAFTLRSVGFNRLTQGHNQRLEFLGDTVMQLISSDYLFRHFPDHHEGHLTLLRSSLVNNKTQACVAEELGLPEYVLRSKNDEINMAQLKPKERADLLESVLGAMYVDGGIEPCTTLCNVCFFPRLEMFILHQDWNDPKSQLQQSCLTLRDSNEEYPDIPVYKVLSQSGPTNTRTFKVAVYFRGKRLAVGEGKTIQQGEMKAAETALQMNKKMFNVKVRARMGLN